MLQYVIVLVHPVHDPFFHSLIPIWRASSICCQHFSLIQFRNAPLISRPNEHEQTIRKAEERQRGEGGNQDCPLDLIGMER